MIGWRNLLPIGLVLSMVAIACSPPASETVVTATTTPAVTPTAAGAAATPTSGMPTLATPVPAATPIAEATPATAATATVVPRSVATAEADGILTGHASIGPLTPVERVGVPTPTPAPQICTSRGLAIYAADGTTLVTSFSFQPDCSYRVALPPGTYVVKLRDGQRGIGGSRSLPKTVSLEIGQTLVLDVDIDTGIR